MTKAAMTKEIREFLKMAKNCKCVGNSSAFWLIMADRYERGRLCSWQSVNRRAIRARRAVAKGKRQKWKRTAAKKDSAPPLG